MADAQILKDIESKILAFQSGSLKQNTLNLFSTLGYYSPHQMNIFENTPEGFLEYLNDNSRTINKNQAYFSEWKNVDFCLQLTNEDVDLSKNQVNHFDSNINSYLLFCIELNKMHYPNRALADITRAMNRLFPKPVFVLFKHGSSLTLSIINRRKHKRDSTKEVLEKITLIKDIDVLKPHRAHIEILFDLSLFELKRNFTINNFDDLHSAWQSVLNISELNKKFYREIANWYFWAMDNVEFPKDAGDEKEVRNATSLIRLLTRLIFVWFLKEKHLVPDDLFDKKFLDTILEYKDKTGSTYYKAILQNLFFATLNTPMTKDNPKSRIFINDAKSKGFVNDGYLQSGYFRYKRFIKNPDLLLEKYSSIPFLNGGLFECLDEKTEGKEIRIDCFSDNPNNEAKLKVPDDLFFGTDRPVDLNKIYGTKNKEYKTRGLINILNSYKFTVAENTPVEEEVALDPELLGKVFENLLASYNPETGTTARKATGSFYTPREIVNYMVDESLIAYLHTKLIEKFPEDDFETKLRQLLRYTDEPHQFNKNEVELLLDAVENLKILDPACGSGAFPMGILHKLVYILYKLDPDNKIWIHKLIERTPFEIREETRQALKDKPMDYVRKLGLIESCIYGVDIQSIAIQISKLRFFISLIVEQKIDDTKENRDIKPLPNLETKFVAANTLIALGKPKDSFAGEVLEIKEAEENLINIRKDIFYANSSTKKKQLALKEKQARQKLKTLLEEKGGFGHDVAEKITSWDPFDQNTHAEWFDPEWMFGVKVYTEQGRSEGFDIVIGNPPYIQLQKDGGKLAQLYQNQNYSSFARTGDIYTLFYERGLQLLKQNGLLTFITSNKWMRAGYGEKLRNFLASKSTPLKLIDFGGYRVFEAATVDTSILIVKNNTVETGLRPVSTNTNANENDTVETGLRPVSKNTNANQNDTVETGLRPVSTKENEFYACTIADDFNSNITIADYFERHKQLMPRMNKSAWIISSDIETKIKEKIEAIGTPLKNWDINIYRGVLTGFNDAFIIDGKKKDELIAQDPKSAEIIKPILRGRDIKRYKADFADLWLIFIPWHFPLHKENISGASLKAEEAFKKEYPFIYNHLLKYKEQLSKRNKAETGIAYEWYALQRCANTYYEEFEKEKIVWNRITSEIFYSFSKQNMYVLDSTFFITNCPIRYFLGLLNSRLIKNWIKNNAATLGEGVYGAKIYIEKLPIPIISPEKQEPFVNLVNIILEKKEKNEDTTAEEREIDRLVYELYELTPEEIEIIEGGKI